MHPCSKRGIALITVLLITSIVFTLALGLSLIVSVDHLAVRNHRESAALLQAAEAGIELAARAMAQAPDWNEALSGAVQAPGADGPPSGTRQAEAGDPLDLGVQTNVLNCGLPAGCGPADLQAVTVDRPWGADNPHWRPFLYGPLRSFAAYRFTGHIYIIAWVADDGREVDGDPERDGLADAPGHGVVRVRADAFGRAGGRRAIEAELVRVCRPDAASFGCLPGIRVQSWRDVRRAVP
ncbi:MAG: hypothetical protein AB7Q16_06350 [Vicinamibacterales bacterium]